MMAATTDDLFARLEALGIDTTTHYHAPLFTVEESKRLRGDLPGGHCKSLFLKDKKGRLFLVVALEDRPVDLKKLRKSIGAGNLSFGKPELLMEVLGIEPGSVTPFALLSDGAGRVDVVLDKAMLEHDPLNYHPLTNGATTAIAPGDLIKFIASTGHQARIVDMDALD
ncbi:MAG: prolyl-tRNA synthetase associated domain-containing protein [Alphaproteobacteria bacterium]|nr:prolyl-tRNA synthetase associated domain-containing protein [Alphaproteobacteria bacterium]